MKEEQLSDYRYMSMYWYRYPTTGHAVVGSDIISKTRKVFSTSEPAPFCLQQAKMPKINRLKHICNGSPCLGRGILGSSADCNLNEVRATSKNDEKESS